MALVPVEKGNEFFSRYKKDASHVILQEGFLPPLSSQDIIEITGGPGCGKTEVLYHFIIRFIMPDTMFNGLNLNGLNTRVILIDNDSRFNLFRLIEIIEVRLKLLLKKRPYTQDAIKSFIRGRLELLEIIQCSNSDEFLFTLRNLEYCRYQKYVLMIDGVTTFYWSDKMRNVHAYTKLMEYLTVIGIMVKNISKKGIITFLTKRKLFKFTHYEGFNFPAYWRNMVTLQLEVTKPHAYMIRQYVTTINVLNITEGRSVSCVIDNAGLKFLLKYVQTGLYYSD